MRLKILVTLLLTVTALFTLSGCQSSKGNENMVQPPVAVITQTVQLFSADQAITYSGTIEEALTVPLTFSVMGTVAEVKVNEGARVRKGQLLATLNTESWQNSYEMMRAKERQAEDAYRRLQPMHASGSLPEIKFVEVETGLQQARAAAALAKKNLDDCKLYATVDGIVGRRNIEPGMGASPVISAITLVRIDTVYARISVSESEVALVREGAPAEIIVSALQKAHFSGQVNQIGVMADPLVHTYKVKIAVPNPDHRLLPGMLCNVALTDPTEQMGVIVPTGCLLVDANDVRYLFVADTVKKIALRREVTPGTLVKTGLQIRAGLSAGEMIVVAGQQKLSDQSLISYNR